MEYKVKVEHYKGFTIRNKYPDLSKEDDEKKGKEILEKLYNLLIKDNELTGK